MDLLKSLLDKYKKLRKLFDFKFYKFLWLYKRVHYYEIRYKDTRILYSHCDMFFPTVDSYLSVEEEIIANILRKKSIRMFPFFFLKHWCRKQSDFCFSYSSYTKRDRERREAYKKARKLIEG